MYRLDLRVGPVGYRVGSAWRRPIDALRRLYAGYPAPDEGLATLTARIEPEKPWRRHLRPQVAIRGDFELPDAVPMTLDHGLLAIEMAMNLQIALGERRHLLLHAGAVERNGRVIILTGESGSGKSTLSALLGEHGWRLLSDEFVLIEPGTGLVRAFPRAISLKNAAIAELERVVADRDRFGPLLRATPKGDLRHLRPAPDAIARMDERAMPALVLFPTFGHASQAEGMGQAELFALLTQGSTNYAALGERGFETMARLATTVPGVRFAYPDSAGGMAIVEQFAAELGI
ncbi:HprK-related kinase A [Sphingomonas montanisoli]|uniref:HprK-related kinase A n=2 Tax=Sphingomonas montanisoli TaxID=2606412 RepID=A0A5D9CAE7_9SPHN|nr:HprK-related kinase A [Sphingomonas montanisoli]TZG28754.1 HprK-related kinase A [Sphingomonas montanisoli]